MKPADLARLIREGYAMDPPKILVTIKQVVDALGHVEATRWACDVAELASDRWPNEAPAAVVEAARAWADCPCREHAVEARACSFAVDVYSAASAAVAWAGKACAVGIYGGNWSLAIQQSAEASARSIAARGEPGESWIKPALLLAADRLEAL